MTIVSGFVNWCKIDFIYGTRRPTYETSNNSTFLEPQRSITSETYSGRHEEF